MNCQRCGRPMPNGNIPHDQYCPAITRPPCPRCADAQADAQDAVARNITLADRCASLEAENTRLRGLVERAMPKCATCGKAICIPEDTCGELSDGRWACSEECYDAEVDKREGLALKGESNE